jgi:hypothetical protein
VKHAQSQAIAFERDHQLPSQFDPPPNAKDQLPGRLQRLQILDSKNAGPVNCIQSFGLFHLA